MSVLTGLCKADITLKFNDSKTAKEFIRKLIGDTYDLDFSYYTAYDEKYDRDFHIVSIDEITWTNNIKWVTSLLEEEEC